MRSPTLSLCAALLTCALIVGGCETPTETPAEATSSLLATSSAEKVDVCHLDQETGTYKKINISNRAYDAHIAHGDGLPGEAVPSMGGYEFNESCVPVEAAACPCFTANDLEGVFWDIWISDVEESLLTEQPEGFAGVCLDPTAFYCSYRYRCGFGLAGEREYMDITGAQAASCQSLVLDRVQSQEPPPVCFGENCPDGEAASKTQGLQWDRPSIFGTK